MNHIDKEIDEWGEINQFDALEMVLIRNLIARVRTSEREKLRKVVEFAVGCCKWLPEASKFSKEAMVRRHNSDLDYILSHLQEPTASRAKEALVKSAEGRLDNQKER